MSQELSQCGILNENETKKYVESAFGVFIGPYYIVLSNADLLRLEGRKFDAKALSKQIQKKREKEIFQHAVKYHPPEPSQPASQSVSFSEVAPQTLWSSPSSSSASSSSLQLNLKGMPLDQRYQWFKATFVGFDIRRNTATGEEYYLISHKDANATKSLLESFTHCGIIKKAVKQDSTHPEEGNILVLNNSHFQLLEKHSLVLPLYSYIACRKARGEGFRLFGFNQKEKIEGAEKLIRAIEHYRNHGDLSGFKEALTPREAGALQDGDLFNKIVRNIISAHPAIGAWINADQDPIQKNKMEM